MKPLRYFFDHPIAAGKGTPRYFERLFAGLLHLVLPLLFRPRIEGTHQLRAHPDLSAGFILAGNHRSYLDPLFVMLALRPRPVRFISKEEFFKLPVIRRLAAWIGAYPVKRGSADMQVIKRSVAMLQRGELVGIFPEGSRGRAGETRQIHSGLGLIAYLSKAPVVPFRLWNTEAISPPGTRLWRFPTVKLAFGQPLSINDARYQHLNKSERLERFSHDVMEATYQLSEPH
ncbi:MAG: 1-acyl-sn-glycerol-3-phosphate acyltransferase [Coriobacteriales bacterium]|jgi:1-acyl-sn-glycerol-3-phosphate acyltransferase|nr:1-acyl-sn-glycerol-3-phosphate acyltransferase [Coriobacteriales bacterium]